MSNQQHPDVVAEVVAVMSVPCPTMKRAEIILLDIHLSLVMLYQRCPVSRIRMKPNVREIPMIPTICYDFVSIRNELNYVKDDI